MSKLIVSFCVVYMIINMTWMPQAFTEIGSEAVDMCIKTVIPSLLPFFICSGLLVSLGFAQKVGKILAPVISPVFNIPGSGAIAFVMGILSGYPVGAKCAVDLYLSGDASKEEAERMTAFCNNSGPMFILGVVGAAFLQNTRLGRVLYLSHIFSALIVGVIFRFYKCGKRSTLDISNIKFDSGKENIGIIIGSVISSSVETILKVCGFVIIFYIFGKSMSNLGDVSLIYGIFEMTSGIAMLVNSKIDLVLMLCLISFFVSFSGISVLLQVSSIVLPVGLSIKPYFIGKILQGAFSFFITYLICLKSPETVSVFAQTVKCSPYIAVSFAEMLKVSLIMTMWCIVVLLILCLWVVICEKLNKKR